MDRPRAVLFHFPLRENENKKSLRILPSRPLRERKTLLRHALNSRRALTGCLHLPQIEPTAFRSHIAAHVIENVARDLAKSRVMRTLKCFEVGIRQLRLIVEHLFEMRDVPKAIDRIAMKSATKLVVHSAHCHFPEGEQYHFERMLTRIAILVRDVKSGLGN